MHYYFKREGAVVSAPEWGDADNNKPFSTIDEAVEWADEVCFNHSRDTSTVDIYDQTGRLVASRAWYKCSDGSFECDLKLFSADGKE